MLHCTAYIFNLIYQSIFLDTFTHVYNQTHPQICKPDFGWHQKTSNHFPETFFYSNAHFSHHRDTIALRSAMQSFYLTSVSRRFHFFILGQEHSTDGKWDLTKCSWFKCRSLLATSAYSLTTLSIQFDFQMNCVCKWVEPNCYHGFLVLADDPYWLELHHGVTRQEIRCHCSTRIRVETIVTAAIICQPSSVNQITFVLREVFRASKVSKQKVSALTIPCLCLQITNDVLTKDM